MNPIVVRSLQHSRWVVLARRVANTLGFSVLLCLIANTGCTRSKSTQPSEDTQQQQVVDPWVEATKRLRKDTDLITCKAVVAQINSGLAGRKDLPRLPVATQETERTLAAVLPLNAQDLEEYRANSLTPLDAIYLADCFYFLDVARSLNHPGLSSIQRVLAAFDWVCRQVYLNPWIIDVGARTGQFVPTVPPTSVLRRGHGTGLERAYVFLSLLQQMRFDACLIGYPDSGNKPASYSVPGRDGKPLTGSPKGPFWAVGVIVDNDILLFDPWWDQALPGPTAGIPATLAQIKANPDVLRVWIDSPQPVWGITRDDVKNAAVFLTVPLSSISPRMAAVQERLQTDTGLNLSVNPFTLRDQIQSKVPSGTSVSFWGPIDDRFAYARVVPEFVPIEDGGRDRDPPEVRRSRLYMVSLLPPSVIELPMSVPSMAYDRLRIGALGSYASSFLEPPSPRERIQRGQYLDAARFLTEKQDGFAKGLERIRQANPDSINNWCVKAREVYADLDRARRPSVDGPVRPDTDPDVISAMNRVELFWKADAGTAQLIIDRATSRAGLTESSFLFALAMHEKAEWLQLEMASAPPADRVKARDAAGFAWKEAASAWRAYLDQTASLDPFAHRKQHAEKLAARATTLANPVGS